MEFSLAHNVFSDSLKSALVDPMSHIVIFLMEVGSGREKRSFRLDPFSSSPSSLSLSLSLEKAISRPVKRRRLPHRSKAQTPHRIFSRFRRPSSILTQSRRISPSSSESKRYKWLSLNTPKPSGSSKRNAGEFGSQTSNTTVGDEEVRPEGSKAAKARKNNTQGIKSMADFTTVMELKKDDLLLKERLSKLAILDTLLAKPGPLSEPEEVVKNKLLALYSQPSDSAEYGGETSEYSETEDLIRRDQEELSLQYGDTAQYPPQYPPQPDNQNPCSWA
ncbi:unnamed protein product [Brassica napus]|uniref:(rape) hypothetical protein n=1 Tax=Brassica napus TaxID=3708 RepID=A0A816U539_BRANA|nr:unnamed protein product [Brassica napus]